MLLRSSICEEQQLQQFGFSQGEFLTPGQCRMTKTRWPGLFENTLSGLAFICTDMVRPAPLMEGVKHRAASFNCIAQRAHLTSSFIIPALCLCASENEKDSL